MGGIFLRSVLVRSKNNNDNFVPFQVFFDFNPITRFDLQRVLIYSQWHRSIFVIAQLTVCYFLRLLKQAFEVTPCLTVWLEKRSCRLPKKASLFLPASYIVSRKNNVFCLGTPLEVWGRKEFFFQVPLPTNSAGTLDTELHDRWKPGTLRRKLFKKQLRPY